MQKTKLFQRVHRLFLQSLRYWCFSDADLIHPAHTRHWWCHLIIRPWLHLQKAQAQRVYFLPVPVYVSSFVTKAFPGKIPATPGVMHWLVEYEGRDQHAVRSSGRELCRGPFVQQKTRGTIEESYRKGCDVIDPPSSTLTVLWNLIWSMSRGKNCLLVPHWPPHFLHNCVFILSAPCYH